MSNAVRLCLMAALIAACAKLEKPKTASLSIGKMAPAKDVATIASLVPTDTTILARVASVEDWEGIVDRIRSDTPMSLPDGLGMLTRSLGLESSAVERGRPLFLCINVQKAMAPPLLTLIAPVKNPGAIRNAAATADGYVALTQLPEYKAGGSPLSDGMMGGDLSARCDLARLVSLCRPTIDSTLHGFEQGFAMAAAQGGARGGGFGKVAAGITEWMRGIVDSAGTLDVVVNQKNGVFDLQLASTPKGDSPAASETRANSRLVEIGGYLPQEMPAMVLLRFDVAGMSQMFMPMMSAMAETLPAHDRKALEDYTNRMNEASKLLSGDWAFAIDLGKEGIRMAIVGTATDAKAYVTAYRELVTSPALKSMGMAFTSGGSRTVAGTAVHRLRMSFDSRKYTAFTGSPDADMEPMMAALFGKDGLSLELAAKDNLVLIATGKLMDSMLNADKPPAWLERAAREIGGELGFFVRVEMRSLAKGGSELTRAMMPGVPEFTYPDGDDLPVLLYGTVEGRVYRVGATADVGKLSAFFRSIKLAR